MKKIFSIIAFLFVSLSFSQRTFAQFSDTAELNNYIRSTITDRRPTRITAQDIQTALLGISNLATKQITIGHTYIVPSQDSMLKLNAHQSDVAIITDSLETFILKDTPTINLSNWAEIVTPAQVQSFNGRVGPVVPQAGDYDISQIRGVPNWITKVISGYGLINLNDSTQAVDSSKVTTVYQNTLKLNKSDAFSGIYDSLKNKPTIPVVPTLVSAFTNDVPYLKSSDISGKLNNSDTAAMLAPYAQKIAVKKSVDSLGALKANDNSVIHQSTNDTITGTKTFSSGSMYINNGTTGVGSAGTIYIGDGYFTKSYGNALSFNSSVAVTGTLNLGLLSHTAGNFVTSAGNGTNLSYRTATEALSDMGGLSAAAAAATYVPVTYRDTFGVVFPQRYDSVKKQFYMDTAFLNTLLYKTDTSKISGNGLLSISVTLDNNFLLAHYKDHIDSIRINGDTSFIPPLRALIKAKADTAAVVFANGKSGGQTIAGGINASGNLTLTSTSNSSKGKINFGSAATDFYDEKGDSLKVGPMSFNYGSISNYILGAPQRVAFPTGVQVFDNVEIAGGAAYAFLSPNHGTQYWSYLSLGSNDNLYFHLNTSVPMIVGPNGVSFSGNDPSPVKDATAKVQISSSDGLAGHGPLKLGAGTLLTTPENGLLEYDNKDLFFTNNLTRYRVVRVTVGSTLSINPFTLGEIYDDTTNKKVYIATGVNSPEGWTEIDGIGTGGEATINDAAPSLTQVYSSSKTTALNAAKADTASIAQTADYVIEKVGSIIYARPGFKSSLPVYSGTDAYTVIQNSINQLRDSGFIFIKKGLYYLTDELTITGLGSGFHTLTVKGSGLATVLYGYTAGKNGLVIKNRAGVDIEDMKIQMESQCKSALFLDSSGTSEVSVMESKFNHLQLISGNASYPALLAENVWFTDFSNIYAVNTGGDAIWLKNASRSGTNYGNSTFSKLDVVHATGVGYAGIRFFGAWGTRGVYDQIKIGSYYDYAEPGTPADYGIYATNVGDVSFSDVDLENLYHPIYLGDQGGTVEGFRVIGGAIITAGDTIITVKGTSSGGNVFDNIGMAGGSSSTVPVYDQCTSYAPNTYDLWLHSTLDPTKLSIAWSSATSVKLRTSTGTQEYLPKGTTVTQNAGNNSTSLATTAYVDNAITGAKYTPTLTNTTNVTSSTFVSATYSRVGNVVTVVVAADLNPTVVSTNSVLTITLPINTTNTTQNVGNGTFYAGNVAAYSGMIQVASTSTVKVYFYPSNTTTVNGVFTFQYSLN